MVGTYQSPCVSTDLSFRSTSFLDIYDNGVGFIYTLSLYDGSQPECSGPLAALTVSGKVVWEEVGSNSTFVNVNVTSIIGSPLSSLGVFLLNNQCPLTPQWDPGVSRNLTQSCNIGVYHVPNVDECPQFFFAVQFDANADPPVAYTTELWNISAVNGVHVCSEAYRETTFTRETPLYQTSGPPAPPATPASDDKTAAIVVAVVVSVVVAVLIALAVYYRCRYLNKRQTDKLLGSSSSGSSKNNKLKNGGGGGVTADGLIIELEQPSKKDGEMSRVHHSTTASSKHSTAGGAGGATGSAPYARIAYSEIEWVFDDVRRATEFSGPEGFPNQTRSPTVVARTAAAAAARSDNHLYQHYYLREDEGKTASKDKSKEGTTTTSTTTTTATTATSTNGGGSDVTSPPTATATVAVAAAARRPSQETSNDATSLFASPLIKEAQHAQNRRQSLMMETPTTRPSAVSIGAATPPINTTDLLTGAFGVMVGEGCSSFVFRAKWHGAEVAVKVMKNQLDTESNLESFENEIRNCYTIPPHPRVIALFGASAEPGKLFVVFTLMELGSIEQFLSKQSLRVDSSLDGVTRVNNLITLLRLAVDASSALMHCHHHRLIHRDVRTANYLVKKDDSGGYGCAITDFGLSRFLPEGEKSGTGSEAGPIQWMAPEAIIEGTYSIATDMYMFGMFLYELIVQEPPYGESGAHLLMALPADELRRLRPTVPDFCPTQIQTILTQLWAEDPERRPDGRAVHKLLTQYLKGLTSKVRNSSQQDVRISQQDLRISAATPISGASPPVNV